MPDGKLELPRGQRIQEIRTRKREERMRAEANAARRGAALRGRARARGRHHPAPATAGVRLLRAPVGLVRAANGPADRVPRDRVRAGHRGFAAGELELSARS